jgi:hypothetical protein
MIGPSNRILIVLLLVGLILSFVHADAQEGYKKGAPNPYLKGTEGYYKGPRGLTSYQPIAIDQPFAVRMANDVAAKPGIERVGITGASDLPCWRQSYSSMPKPAAAICW